MHKVDMLVNELLTLARAESSADTTAQYFDPMAIVAEGAADAQFEAETRQIAVTIVMLDVDEDVRPICVGSGQLFARAFDNILRNALAHTPSGGRIEVLLREAGEDAGALSSTCFIRVNDTGPGVPEDRLPSIFQTFVRQGGPGYGLGLAIALRAISAMGGSLRAANRAAGGLSMAIKLPVFRGATQPGSDAA